MNSDLLGFGPESQRWPGANKNCSTGSLLPQQLGMIDTPMPLRDSKLVGSMGIGAVHKFAQPEFSESEGRLSLELVLQTPKHYAMGEGENTAMNKTESSPGKSGNLTTPHNPEPSRIQKEMAARAVTMKSQTPVVGAKSHQDSAKIRPWSEQQLIGVSPQGKTTNGQASNPNGNFSSFEKLSRKKNREFSDHVPLPKSETQIGTVSPENEEKSRLIPLLITSQHSQVQNTPGTPKFPTLTLEEEYEWDADLDMVSPPKKRAQIEDPGYIQEEFCMPAEPAEYLAGTEKTANTDESHH
jgi:hypothetical protein